jgi:hypothetical protein
MRLLETAQAVSNRFAVELHILRFGVRKNYRNLLGQVSRRHGDKKLSKIKARTLLKWHADWLDGEHYADAHAFVKRFRTVFGFGLMALKDKTAPGYAS